MRTCLLYTSGCGRNERKCSRRRRRGRDVHLYGLLYPCLLYTSPSEKVRELARRAQQIPFEKEKIVSSCSAQQIKLTGKNASGVAVQMRKTGQETLIFLLNMDRDHAAGKVTLSLEEDGYPELWDAMSGKIAACVFRKKDGRMEIPLTFAAGEEKLLVITAQCLSLIHIYTCYSLPNTIKSIMIETAYNPADIRFGFGVKISHTRRYTPCNPTHRHKT